MPRTKSVRVRRATPEDIAVLEDVETRSFPKYKISTRRQLRLSLKSPYQAVWIAEIRLSRSYVPCGAMVVHLHKKSVRLFSICVLPEHRGKGTGDAMLSHLEQYALANSFTRITLEAKSDDERLLAWYQNAGFVRSVLLSDYYAAGIDAVRMFRTVPGTSAGGSLENIIIVDRRADWTIEISGVAIVSAREYITQARFLNSPNFRVFNLCGSYRYQSVGYYVSLLASAREHRAIPNITTIRDFGDLHLIRSVSSEIDELIQTALARTDDQSIAFNIYFGQTIDPAFRTLGSRLYSLFEAPLFTVEFRRKKRWEIIKATPVPFRKVPAEHYETVQTLARNYFSRKRFRKTRLKNYIYDLAILIDPDEKNPPSCPESLSSFKMAAEKTGFYTEFITRDDADRISEFDALFIRTTTGVNDYTYQLSRIAYAEGLVVIDDPWSILRCSNKIYLNERLRQNGILTPKTWVLTKTMSLASQLKEAEYPLVLKQPDSAFSLGVTRVSSFEELKSAVDLLFRKSDLLLVQQFLYSDYDWRIGVLESTPVYACRYFMAKGHWQIYDWNGGGGNNSGEADALPVESVPPNVLKTAVRAASLMGDGLYGVDLKEVNGRIYCIEVNDNPNIDAGLEDAVLGEQLYGKIMQSFMKRIEMSRNIARFVSHEPG